MSLLDNAKPILFNTEMVKAILDGRKTQTRRLVPTHFEISQISEFNANGDKNIYPFRIFNKKLLNVYDTHDIGGCFNHYIKHGYKVDDILYVRETFGEYYQMCNHGNFCDCEPTIIYKSGKNYHYDTDCIKKWKPSIHMPKEYARIFLKVTNVGVERLQDILVGDIIAEGYYNPDCTNHSRPHYFAEMAKKWWANLWNSTARDGYKWEYNPYVFVYEFERINYERFS